MARPIQVGVLLPRLANPLTPALGRLCALAESPAVEPPLVLTLVAVSLVAQGLNMFHYPAFTWKEDEGIYAAQAWAVLREQRLSPYTYFYDHAPAGWIMLAGWMWLTGGPGTFGSAISVAALATLLFSVSPLAIFYQRFLLLDTIMLFWVLLSLDLLLNGRGQLSRVGLSGICFGLALLTKETAIFLTPGLLFIVLQDRWRHQGRFAAIAWLLPMLSVLSWYPLYAALKGELLPTGGSAQFTVSGYATSSVSLADALLWQAARSGGGLLNPDNQFFQLLRGDWLPRDALLVVGGALATVVNVPRGLHDRRALAASFLGALPILYLARGGLVLDFYVLIAVPFFCLNLAIALAPVFARIPPPGSGALALVAASALIGGYWQAGLIAPLYTGRPDRAGREAIGWIKQHLAPDSLIVTRDDFWADLHEPGLGGPAFPNVHSHWKVAADPEVRGGVFYGTWQRVDYVIVSPGMLNDLNSSNNTITLEALQRAHLVRRWASDGGDLELWKVDKAGQTEMDLLAAGNALLRRRFEQDGAFVDANGTIRSESQSYAMLRAVWSGDRAGFDRAWQWTRNHLADADGLLAWEWRDGAVVDGQTASDADTDTALALLMASRLWGDPALLDDGRHMIQAIWRREIVVVDGKPYLTAGDWAGEGSIAALNPSYFSPYAYHVFQEVDGDHDWLGVIDSGYRVLFAASQSPLLGERSAGLPPDWIGLDRVTAEVVPLASGTTDTTRYGYDAARAFWRIAIDLRWNADGRADAYLRQAGFLQDEISRNGAVAGVYAHDGTVLERAPSLIGTAGALAALLTLDPPTAHALHAARILGDAQRSGDAISWGGEPNDLYSQEWGWFATALYSDRLLDLWHPHERP